ncbi:hypothetical protein HYC85_028376 [Camellia sinensis]|uniref:Uncharacterized protein n=1 Tax=Camellia sinensis TaxID=4442 RepID=A0A7J7FV41_CAMSI|nr:hypothetical protein HYC85_028376 [Camellia sinensis]
MRACYRLSAGQREALPTNDEALPTINVPVPATGVLNCHTAIEHRQRKMECFPRICLYHAPPYHLKTSKEWYSWIQNHQSCTFNA